MPQDTKKRENISVNFKKFNIDRDRMSFISFDSAFKVTLDNEK